MIISTNKSYLFTSFLDNSDPINLLLLDSQNTNI